MAARGKSKRAGALRAGSADRRSRVVAALLVAGASAFTFAAFRSEIRVSPPMANDHILHFAMVQRVADVWESGGNPRDPWIPYWGQGFPVLRYYQHLPHVAVVWIYRLLQESVPLFDVFRGFHMLVLVALPWSFYLGARWLGMERISAAWVAVCTPLLGAAPERYLLGFQFESFVWRGSGLFPQEVAMLLLPLSLGSVAVAVRSGRAVGRAVLLLSATWLSHLLIGYSACLLGALLLLRPGARGGWKAASLRLAGVYAATCGVILYLLLPTLLESELLSRSVWEDAAYWDSFGMAVVLKNLVRGALFDGERLPVLTGLALAGLLLAGWRSEREGAGAFFARAAFAVSLLLYFGRPTWGVLYTLVPFSGNLPLHRFLCAVQFSALLLAGLALGALWRGLGWERSPARGAAALAASLALLAPALASTWRSGADLHTAAVRYAAEFERSGVMLEGAMEAFQAANARKPARGFAGTSWDGGGEYQLAWVPVYTFWTGHRLPAISYMYHTMGRNSDLEVEFDPGRRDHYELYNVAYHLTPDPSRVPPFARVVSQRTGVIASLVETPGYFDLVAADRVFDATAATAEQVYELNKRFIASPWHAAGRFVRVHWSDSETLPEDAVRLDAEEAFAPESLADWTRPAGRVLRSGGADDRFVADVEAEAPAVVLFRMTFHPGWRVTVNERPASTIMLSPSYLGVPVEAGEHRVEVRWDPGIATQLLFWLGLGVLGLALLAERLGIFSGGPRPAGGRVALESLGALALLALAWLASA